jgi:hypothetical protein
VGRQHAQDSSKRAAASTTLGESTRCRTSSERTEANSSPSLYEKHPSFLVYVSHRMVTFSVKDYVQTEIDSVSFMTKIIL